MRELPEHDRLLTSTEVARMFAVDPKTVNRWEMSGLFPVGSVTRTLGGHRRFSEPVIRRMLAEGGRQS